MHLRDDWTRRRRGSLTLFPCSLAVNPQHNEPVSQFGPFDRDRFSIVGVGDDAEAKWRSCRSVSLASKATRRLELIAAGNRRWDLCPQTSIDCWAKIPAIAPCHDAVVTDGGVMGLARSPAA